MTFFVFLAFLALTLSRLSKTNNFIIWTSHTSTLYKIGKDDLYSKSRQKLRVEARSVLCYWAVRELGAEGARMAKRSHMSQPGVAYALKKGEKIVKDNGFQMMG